MRKPQQVCPICDAPTQEETAPFCSQRCKDIDLNRWLNDGYRIPGNPSGDDSDGISDLTDEGLEARSRLTAITRH